jgi:predicted O-methyltransferase YrrM
MEYTSDLFSRHIPVWKDLFGKFNPQTALEIGSYEGRSAEWLLDNIPGLELTCIDAWDNNQPCYGLDNESAEKIFDAKVGGRAKKLKGDSGEILRSLKEEYDFIYIDGNHSASAVLEDMVLSFRLLKKNGVMICDDYTGGWGGNHLHYPKLAIDSFVNCFWDKLDFMLYPASQIYIVKK